MRYIVENPRTGHIAGVVCSKATADRLRAAGWMVLAA